MLDKLVEEIMPSAEGLRQLAPKTSASVEKFFETFSKQSRRAQIAKGQQRRKADLLRITKSCLGRLVPRHMDDVQARDIDAAFDRVADSAERFCFEVLMEAI